MERRTKQKIMRTKYKIKLLNYFMHTINFRHQTQSTATQSHKSCTYAPRIRKTTHTHTRAQRHNSTTAKCTRRKMFSAYSQPINIHDLE